jgi:Zn-dependent metalloprotease
VKLQTQVIAAITFAAASITSVNAAPLKLIESPSNTSYQAVGVSASVQAQLKAEVATRCGLPSGMSLTQTSIADGVWGDIHVRYRKSYNGLLVYGTQTIAHISENGSLSEISDADLVTSGVAATAAITKAQATSAATAAATAEGAFNVYIATSPVLCYFYSAEESSLVLCYKVGLNGDYADRPMREDIFVNATNSSVVMINSLIKDSKFRRIYNANNVKTDGTLSRSEGQSAVSNAAVNYAYNNLGLCYDYFAGRYGRDSYDDMGAKIDVTVNYIFDYGGGDNASWSGAAKRFYFGNGTPTYSVNMAVPVDVSAHEYFHAITDSTSDLYYAYQSGALNEALSDIFASVLQWNKEGTISARVWTMGEDIGSPLRRLDNP